MYYDISLLPFTACNDLYTLKECTHIYSNAKLIMCTMHSIKGQSF